MCAGQGGKELLYGVTLQVGADWAQTGEEVTAAEVLTGSGPRQGL